MSKVVNLVQKNLNWQTFKRREKLFSDYYLIIRFNPFFFDPLFHLDPK